ncbi:MAG TPA: hypothetical protein PLQ78_05455, partial [Flavipsychrobacter sp.]|nr:hypothetical protein [Flavipsychrobacter sp.]
MNPPTSGWYAVTLQTPFLYDPSLTLVFELKASTSSGGSSSSNGMMQSSVGQRKYAGYTATTGTIGSNLSVDFGFDLVPNGPCTSPPTAGTTTVSNATPCFGQGIMLNLSGNSYGTGQTYQWQRATSVTGPWINEGSSQSFPVLGGVTPPSGINFYRCLVTCGATTDSSVIDTVTVPSPFPGGTYTINPALPASSTNFQTIGAAVSAISCGIAGSIVFNLASGNTFNEQVTLPATIGANATNTVTFNGNGDTVKFAGTSTQPWTLGLDGADYITFNNFIVSSIGTSYGLTTHLWNGADNNSFNNCIFLVDIAQTSSLFSPFSISGSATSSTTAGTSGSYNIVDSCTMVGGYYNTCIVGNTSASSNGNKVMNSLMTDFYLYGTYFTYQDSLEITNNIIERPTRTTLSTFYGIYLSTGCTNALVQQNRVRNMCGSTPNYAATVYGIYVAAAATSGNDNMIYNNLVSNFNNNSTVYGLYLTGQYMKIYHNTLSIDNTNATAGTIRGVYATGTAGIDMMNNNIYITQGGTGAKHCMYFSNATGKTSNYNNLYIGSTAGTNYIGYFSTNLATLANWQGANSNAWDQNSVSLDPQFAAPLVGIFSPTNALFDNLGTPIAAVTVDINGASRSASTPDIGAFEFSVSNCSGAPNAGIATGPTATLCSGSAFSLNTTGFTIAAGISVQWQSSPASAGTWTDITGATTFGYNVPSGVSTSTDYRAVVTCTNSFLTDTTNVVTVSIAPLFPAGTYTINPALPASSTNF